MDEFSACMRKHVQELSSGTVELQVMQKGAWSLCYVLAKLFWSTVARGVMEAEGNKKKQRNIDKINGDR